MSDNVSRAQDVVRVASAAQAREKRSDAPSVPCPHCGGSESHVTHTRLSSDPAGIRRYRTCENSHCLRRFVTIEHSLAA